MSEILSCKIHFCQIVRCLDWRKESLWAENHQSSDRACAKCRSCYTDSWDVAYVLLVFNASGDFLHLSNTLQLIVLPLVSCRSLIYLVDFIWNCITGWFFQESVRNQVIELVLLRDLPLWSLVELVVNVLPLSEIFSEVFPNTLCKVRNQVHIFSAADVRGKHCGIILKRIEIWKLRIRVVTFSACVE
jgi:hypothetical protein